MLGTMAPTKEGAEKFWAWLHRTGIFLASIMVMGPEMSTVIPEGKVKGAVQAVGLIVGVISSLEKARGAKPATEAAKP